MDSRESHIGNYMVTNSDHQLDEIFLALADPTRRGILTRLGRSPMPVGELARAFPISRPAISKHLDILERSGLVRRVKEGRSNRCVFEPRTLDDAFDWLEMNRRQWTRQLEALARFVETDPETS